MDLFLLVMAQEIKWGLLGSARTGVQFISYEVVTGLSLICSNYDGWKFIIIDFNEYQAWWLWKHWIVWSSTYRHYLIFQFPWDFAGKPNRTTIWIF